MDDREQARLRQIWGRATDDEILEAFHLESSTYLPEALEVLKEEVEKRGLTHPDPKRVSAIKAGRRLFDRPCLFCGSRHFSKRKALLNTAMMSFFGLDWLNATATCLICNDCGYVHWFRDDPERR